MYCSLLASPKIDPIKFSMSTTASTVGINEEFQIDIKAAYMYVPSNTAFVFEGANSFRLKLILPDGFEQTGGDFTDLVSADLSPQKPLATYTLKGKFTRDAPSGIFQLLRSHKKADNQSTFIQVATIDFKAEQPVEAVEHSAARIALQQTPSYISYMTIAQLRSGLADTSRAVFVTDDLRYGLFRYNPASSAADDGAMTIVAGGRRYERVYDGAVNVNWFGIVADGTNDQSAAIQVMLNNAKYRNVFFPKGNASYRIRSIRIPSYTTMVFEEGTVVEGMGTLGTTEKMMYMYDVGNIIIRGHGVTFKDLRQNYTSGQHRHIFSLEGVINVVIEGMAANDSGGDGFYLGAGSYRKVSENVKFIDVSANNNRRHGMAITTAKNLDIINAVLTNTIGEGPQAGLNFEPNNAENRLEGIRVENPRTAGNTGPGIVVSPNALGGSADRVVDITISNHLDDGSQYGFLATTVRAPLAGAINLESPTWKNSKFCGFVSRNWSYRACTIMVTNPSVINSNTAASTSPTAGAAFYVHREAADTGESNIGNVHIVNPRIMDLRSPQLIQRAFAFRDWTSANPKIVNCSIIDPIKVATYFPQNNLIVNAEITLSDRNATMVHDFNQWNSMADYTYYRPLYHNQTSPAARNLVLGKVNAGFPEVTVEVRAPFNINIYPNATDNIMPLSAVNGKYITSKVVGSKIKLRKASDNSWYITEMIGTWTVQP